MKGAQHRKVDLEQYYTNDETAEKFCQIVDEIYGFDNFDMVLEPSAGAGHILEKLPKSNRVGLDLDPHHDEVKKQDFFEYFPDDFGIFNRPKILTVGNPPFGKNSKLAVDFFNHASQFSDTICFIIPITWLKYTIHKKLDKSFGLFYSEILDPHCFLVDGKPVSQEIRCVAQCWSKQNPGRENLRIYQKPKSWHEDFDVVVDGDFDTWMVKWGSFHKHIFLPPTESPNEGSYRKIKFIHPGAEKIFRSIDWKKETEYLNVGVWFLAESTMVDTYEKYKTLNRP